MNVGPRTPARLALAGIAGVLLNLAWCCAEVNGQAATISGPPNPVSLGSPVFLDVMGSTAPGGFGWSVVGPDGEDAAVPIVPLFDSDGHLAYAVCRPSTPGRHVVVLVAVGSDDAPDDGKPAPFDVGVAEVVVGDVGPIPTPNPPTPPTPTPDPIPVPPRAILTGPWRAYVVFPAGGLTTDAASVVASKAAQGAVEKAGGRLMRMEVPSEAWDYFSGGRAIDYVVPPGMRRDLPLVIFQDGMTGKVVATMPPTSPDDVIQAVRNLTARGEIGR